MHCTAIAFAVAILVTGLAGSAASGIHIPLSPEQAATCDAEGGCAVVRVAPDEVGERLRLELAALPLRVDEEEGGGGLGGRREGRVSLVLPRGARAGYERDEQRQRDRRDAGDATNAGNDAGTGPCQGHRSARHRDRERVKQ